MVGQPFTGQQEIKGHPDALEFILNSGLDANARDDRGASPLHLAKSVKNARLLIDHGANLDARDNNGRTPEQSIDEYAVWYFVGLVRTFRETRQRWSPVFGLDREETDRDRDNQEGDNRQETEETRTAVKTFLLPKALHQLFGQPGNVLEMGTKACTNVAFLGLRKNGPKVIEERNGTDKKYSERKDPPKDPSMHEKAEQKQDNA